MVISEDKQGYYRTQQVIIGSLGEGGVFVLLVIDNLSHFRNNNLPVHSLRFTAADVAIPQYF